MEILLVLAVSMSNLLCFIVAAKVAQATAKGEEIKLPSVKPLELIQEARAKAAAKEEQDKVATILRNIESYDGTAYGQEEVK